MSSGRGGPKGPGEFSDTLGDSEELPREETGERIKKALEEGIEVSEQNRSHAFARKAAEDTTDNAWEGGIFANRMADGRYASPEAPSRSVEEEQPAPLEPMKSAPPSPDFHEVGSVDSENPIKFLFQNPLSMDGEDYGELESPTDALDPNTEEIKSFLASDDPMEPAPWLDTSPVSSGDSHFMPPPPPVSRQPAPPTQPPPRKATPPPALPKATRPPAARKAPKPAEQEHPAKEPSRAVYEDVVPQTNDEVIIGIGQDLSMQSLTGTPPPDLRRRLRDQRLQRTYQMDDDDETPFPAIPVLFLFALLLLDMGAGGFLILLSSGPDKEEVVEELVSGTMDTPAPIPLVTLPDVMLGGERDIPVADGAVVNAAPPPAAAPAPAAGPAPAMMPTVSGIKKQVQRKEVTATPASNAVVTVTANRKAMIRVDGVPKGYPPLNLALSPGSYEISAAMPNRADTEQSKTITVKKGQALNVGFVF